MPCYKKIIKSGDVMEVELYKSIRTRGKRIPKQPNKAPTIEKQKQLNEINRRKRLQRLVNTNFKAGDLYITLTYRNAPDEREEAERHLKNYLRRLNYHRKKQGLPPLKYIAVTECTGHRIHHHLIIESMNMDTIYKLWTFGACKIIPLYQFDHDYNQLASYLSKERKHGKSWHQSKNLKQPEIQYKEPTKAERKALHSNRPVIPRLPKEYRLTSSETLANNIIGILYYFRFVRIDS